MEAGAAVTAPNPSGSLDWHALRSRRDHFPPTLATAEVIAELARRKVAEHQTREEAAIRAALTERVKKAIFTSMNAQLRPVAGGLDHQAFDFDEDYGLDWDAVAEAAVDALEQFYNDGRKAMGGAL